MTDLALLNGIRVEVSGAPGATFADIARKTGAWGVGPNASDLEVAFALAAYLVTNNPGLVGPAGPTGTVTDASGFLGAVAIPAGSGAKPFIRRASDVATIATMDTNSAFTGYAGPMSKGAGRLTIGTNAASGDDSAVLLTREVVGDTHSHGFRDESTVNGTVAANAYACFDAVARFIGPASPVVIDHFRGFQSRLDWDRNGTIEEYNGFGSTVTVRQGTVGNAYDFRVSNMVRTGGTVANHFGLYMDVLTGATTNVSIFVQNDCYLLGAVQIDGHLTGVDDLTASGEARAKDLHVSGGPTTFYAAGGMLVAGVLGTAAYAGLQAYEDASAAPKGLTIQPNGGQLLVGAGAPVTGAKLEVAGNGSFTTLRLTAIPTYADDTAAGVGGLVAGAMYKTGAGAVMVKQ